MHIDHFADFMFVKNTNDAVIELTLPEVTNNKDMFFFLVDLVCKGLVLLFGSNNRLEISSLGMEDFKTIKHKMGLAGIDVHLSLKEGDDFSPKLNLQHIEDTFADNLPLKEYVFKINNVDVAYEISFDLFHKIL